MTLFEDAVSVIKIAETSKDLGLTLDPSMLVREIAKIFSVKVYFYDKEQAGQS